MSRYWRQWCVGDPHEQGIVKRGELGRGAALPRERGGSGPGLPDQPGCGVHGSAWRLFAGTWLGRAEPTGTLKRGGPWEGEEGFLPREGVRAQYLACRCLRVAARRKRHSRGQGPPGPREKGNRRGGAAGGRYAFASRAPLSLVSSPPPAHAPLHLPPAPLLARQQLRPSTATRTEPAEATEEGAPPAGWFWNCPGHFAPPAN